MYTVFISFFMVNITCFFAFEVCELLFFSFIVLGFILVSFTPMVGF